MPSKSLKNWEKIVGFVFGCVFLVALLFITVLIPNPTPTQYATFKTVLALAAAGVAGILAGFLEVNGKIQNVAVRAGGALAVFLMIFLLNPAAPKSDQTPSVKQEIHSGGQGVIPTGEGDIYLGYTIQKHQTIIEKERRQLRNDFERVHTRETGLLESEKQTLENELNEVEQRLANIDASYQDQIKFLQETIVVLRSLRGVVDDSLLIAAEDALLLGNTGKADTLYKQVDEQAKGPIALAATAVFQRGKIAEQNIRYTEAFNHYQRAVGLAPKTPVYLSTAGSMAGILANHAKQIEWKTEALNLLIKREGEQSPNVAEMRNNLGHAWNAKGDVDKAIKYYELTLASDLNTIGEDHPSVAIRRNNLGGAWQAKGDYDKAIKYLELALKGLEKSLGRNHPNYLAVQNNLKLTRAELASN